MFGALLAAMLTTPHGVIALIIIVVVFAGGVLDIECDQIMTHDDDYIDRNKLTAEQLAKGESWCNTLSPILYVGSAAFDLYYYLFDTVSLALR